MLKKYHFIRLLHFILLKKYLHLENFILKEQNKHLRCIISRFQSHSESENSVCFNYFCKETQKSRVMEKFLS